MTNTFDVPKSSCRCFDFLMQFGLAGQSFPESLEMKGKLQNVSIVEEEVQFPNPTSCLAILLKPAIRYPHNFSTAI